MKADIDFDITCHFGHFRNLELPKRGIYCVSVGLFYGAGGGGALQQVPPHGCFSAPMKHSSFVGDFELDAAPAVDMCEIQNNGEESYFCTRTFIIRYRDESHEINEGTHWRVTVPDFDLSLLDQRTHAISCTELLTMRFNLYHSDLCGVTPASDLMHDLPKYMPDEPEFSLLAQQDLELQQVGSGFHHYFPVSFTKQLDASLDVMIHCAITKIEYSAQTLSGVLAWAGQQEEHNQGGWFSEGQQQPSAIREDHYEHRNDEETHTASNITAATRAHQQGGQSSSLDDSISAPVSHEEAPSPRSPPPSPSTRIAPPSRRRHSLLHIGRRAALPSTSGKPSNLISNCSNQLDTSEGMENEVTERATSGLQRTQIEDFWSHLAQPLVNNFEEIVSGIVVIASAIKSEKVEIDVTFDFVNPIASNREQIVQALMKKNSVSELKRSVAAYLDTCSVSVGKLWVQAIGLCTRHMEEACRYLRRHAQLHMRAFWKGQCFVHTCSSLAMRLPRHTEESLASLLMKALRSEDDRLAIENSSIPETIIGGDVSNSRLPFARGLRVYDADIHRISAKLPITIIQKYEKNSSDLESLEILRRGDTLLLPSSPSATPSSAPPLIQNEDVHMNLLKQAGAFLPSVSTDTDEAANVARISSSRDVKSPSAPLDAVRDLRRAPPPYSGQYVVVLVHGFQGTSYDMKILKNAMREEFSGDTLFLSSKYNEGSSGDSLAAMGKRLASEIVDFMNDKCPRMLRAGREYEGRVVFVGHSAGGLIIRKSLEDPRLASLVDGDKLHAYMSLSSPHLGTQYGESQLVATGMWAMYQLKKSPLLQELALKDGGEDGHSCELYRLTENGVLQHFHRVIFVSSPSDLYVPLFSARVQVNSRAVLDAKTGHVVVEMAANLMTQIEPERLFRVTLDNQVDGPNMSASMKNVDKVIGRTAHICYLEDRVVAMQLVKTLYGLLS